MYSTAPRYEQDSHSDAVVRAGFDLDNPGISLSADVWYRLGGENTTKEWGFMLSGIGLGLDDLFGSGGGR